VCRVDAHDQRAIVKRGKFDASVGGQAGLVHTALASEHEDSHTPIVRAERRLMFVRKDVK
jgi:hypothetical protein